MDHKRHHWLEKTQVELETIAAVLAVYFFAWPAIRPPDPAMPLAFVSAGGWSGAGKFALMFVLLALVSAVATIKARAEGAALVCLIGAGGLSLRSSSAIGLMQISEDRLGGLFWQMLLEMAMMAAALAAAVAIIDLIRRQVFRRSPGLIWISPLDKAAEKKEKFADNPLWNLGQGKTLTGIGAGLADRGANVLKACGCLLISLALGLVITMLFIQSADRGQILFAMFAGFFLSALAADQFCPTRIALAAWCSPIPAGILLYLISAVNTAGRGQTWTSVNAYGLALPIDWLTFGCGGAVLGAWVSQRIRESALLEKATNIGEKNE
ncbi:MAG: hypothetical protein HZA50_12250 [Planctomycetes bacterium]|nr:hypothetical protein [Planctomycetota bacterium]